jgi:hypothetical protein
MLSRLVGSRGRRGAPGWRLDRPHVAQQDVREAGPHMKMGRMNVSEKTWRAIGITLLVVLLFSFLVWGCVQVWPSPECASREDRSEACLECRAEADVFECMDVER